MDPYIKFKPYKWPFLYKHRQAVRFLRKTGKEQILKRLEMIKNNDELPNDILTTILMCHSKLFFLDFNSLHLQELFFALFEKEENYLNIETMVDDFITFFVGGISTRLSSINFALLILSLKDKRQLLPCFRRFF